MNRSEFIEFHLQFCEKMHKIMLVKNSDYTTDSNPFSNFEKAELLGICSNEAGFLIRIMDKVSRVISFLNKGELLVKDESVTDSLMDAANYFILLAGYIESKKQTKQADTELNELDKRVLNYANGKENWSNRLKHFIPSNYGCTAEELEVSLKKLEQLNLLKVDNEGKYEVIVAK